MWRNSLKLKVTVSLVICIILLDAIGYVVAQRNFEEAELANAREDSAARINAMSSVLEIRFQEVVERVGAASARLGKDDVQAILLDLRLQKYGAVIALGQGGSVLATDGEAATNDTLHAKMMDLRKLLMSRKVEWHGEWLLIAARSHNLQHTVLAAMHRDALRESVLARVVISGDAIALLTPDGGMVTAITPDIANASAPMRAAAKGVAIPAEERAKYLVASAPLRAVDMSVAEFVPLARLEARADALALRFFLISTMVLAVSGIITLGIVARSLSPLERITKGAERLSRGDEDLGLDVRTNDEMQVLAEVLNRAARDIAEARRRQDAFAESLRAAAQDFEVAVGGLSRSVGEAETPDEIARRLADAILLVTGCRAVAVLRRDRVLEAREPGDEGASGASPHVAALVASDPEAFTWFVLGDADEQVRVALLPREDVPLTQAESRKVEILAAQGAFAFHRARATENLQRAHDQLDESLRQKQIFVDILSHDLKNPIAVARGRAEMLARKDPAAADKARAILDAMDRATAIIEEAVVFSRLEGQNGLDLPVSDLRAFAEEAAASLRPLAAQRGIEIRVDGPPRVETPANRLLVRAIENILSNAIKWSPQDGSVELVLARERGTCRIHIIDHGPGIAPEDRPRLFGRFQRADRTGVKGTGLGLAIAKRVIDLHHGAVDIGDTPGGGCTITVTLPRAADAHASRSATAGEEATTRQGGNA